MNLDGGENSRLDKELIKRLKMVTIIGIILCTALFIKLLMREQFHSVESFQLYMKQFGVFAPLVLTLIQVIQVVFPILPGYLGCAAGAIAFGSTVGFWCNYIGISVGSIIAYYIARKYGIDVVMALFSEKLYNKWSRRILQSKSYDAFLFVATLLPLFPDDFLCYFSGLIKMDQKKFIWIILLGKPWCILAYSLGFGLIQ